MIKKIELKIFLIVFVLLTVLIGAIIAYNTYNSYDMTVKGISGYAERIFEDKSNITVPPDGFYAVRIADNHILDESLYDEEIITIVNKILNSKSESGIIGDYIYRNRRRMDQDRMRWKYYFA